MNSNDTDDTTYRPHFQVTQAEYDAASPEERAKFNYKVVDDTPLDVPESFNIPKTLDHNE